MAFRRALKPIIMETLQVVPPRKKKSYHKINADKEIMID